MTNNTQPLLDVNDLHVRFSTNDGAGVHAVQGNHMPTNKGETGAGGGESGPGKSQGMRSAMGMLAETGWGEGGTREGLAEVARQVCVMVGG